MVLIVTDIWSFENIITMITVGFIVFYIYVYIYLIYVHFHFEF